MAWIQTISHAQPTEPHGVHLQQLRAPVNSTSRSVGVVVCCPFLAGYQHAQRMHHVILCVFRRQVHLVSICDVVASVTKNIGVQFDPSQLDDNIERFSHAMAISSSFVVVPNFCGHLTARNEVCCAPTQMAPRTPSQLVLLLRRWFCLHALVQVHFVQRCFFHSG